jgi:hypothetical protein
LPTRRKSPTRGCLSVVSEWSRIFCMLDRVDYVRRVPVVVNDSQMAYRSLEPPSWVAFLAETDWWVKLLAANAALYGAELTKEAAKGTWRAIAGLISGKGAGPVDRLAVEVAKLRQQLNAQTKVEIGLPIPDEFFATRLEIRGNERTLIAVEIALFVNHLPALQKLIEENKLTTQAASGILLTLEENGDLRVSWIDGDTFEEKCSVICVDDNG